MNPTRRLSENRQHTKVLGFRIFYDELRTFLYDLGDLCQNVFRGVDLRGGGIFQNELVSLLELSKEIHDGCVYRMLHRPLLPSMLPLSLATNRNPVSSSPPLSLVALHLCPAQRHTHQRKIRSHNRLVPQTTSSRLTFMLLPRQNLPRRHHLPLSKTLSRIFSRFFPPRRGLRPLLHRRPTPLVNSHLPNGMRSVLGPSSSSNLPADKN